MYLFGVKYCYNLDRLQIACCHLVFVKKSPSFQNVDIFSELDRCTPCVFIGTVARFSRNKSLLISFGAPVHEQTIFIPQVAEQTIYFSFFANKRFFSQNKNSPLPPPQELNGRPLKQHCVKTQ